MWLRKKNEGEKKNCKTCLRTTSLRSKKSPSSLHFISTLPKKRTKSNILFKKKEGKSIVMSFANKDCPIDQTSKRMTLSEGGSR